MVRTGLLEQYVAALTALGARDPGSPGHIRAREFINEQLRAARLEGYSSPIIYEHPYHAGQTRLCNFAAVLPGTNPMLDPVLIGAHYDSLPQTPGADDNAAAVAILLTAIAPLREAALDRTILFTIFDAEEPPYYQTQLMGSAFFYEVQRRHVIHCALIMDLCGHDLSVSGIEDILFVTGMESDPAMVDVVREAAADSGVRVLPTLNRYIGDLSDHWVFRRHERPYLFLTCGRWDHYHQPTDTPDLLNYEKMDAIADFLTAAAISAARTEFDGPFEGYDTTPVELEFISSSVGDILESLGFTPKTRQDIDLLVMGFMKQFGL